MPISVVIADDHGVLRGGLRALLKAESDLEVIGEAADGYVALTLVSALHPDVLLADISMPGPSGIDIAAKLHKDASPTRVLILTMHEDGSLLNEAMRAGAAGYIVKRAVEADLINAIRIVAAGGEFVQPNPSLAMTLPSSSSTTGGDGSPMTDLEQVALRLIAQGHTTRQIADHLCVDTATVDGLRASLLRKLGLRGRIDLTRYAREHGLIG
jgi:DNA-binding NarL/FixJ family response regulator